ncbi:hypothetical protein [Chitinophaga cymbidii]|uniref:DUF4136 domain-containing protein n=1 Tax=Chitinophaga cymbidii TaxID=1096750 RepID=A0A512RMV2_9BACT|nr:hypothetical protein [Chitinophaga cymbidii]GEP97021.1 hypothetical protein CCY01nite_32810 [Chitinophaga cymbidii]
MRILLLLIPAALLLPGCYSMRLTGAWEAPHPPPRKYQKVFVLGMMPDTALRRRMELHVAGDLARRGIQAFTASQDFDPFAFTATEDKDPMQQFRARGYDGVLTITLLHQFNEGFFLPGSLYYLLCDQYAKDYLRLYAPEFYREAEQYSWESNFYDVREGTRVLALQTYSFNPGSLDKMAHQNGKLITRQLFRRNILSRR